MESCLCVHFSLETAGPKPPSCDFQWRGSSAPRCCLCWENPKCDSSFPSSKNWGLLRMKKIWQQNPKVQQHLGSRSKESHGGWECSGQTPGVYSRSPIHWAAVWQSGSESPKQRHGFCGKDGLVTREKGGQEQLDRSQGQMLGLPTEEKQMSALQWGGRKNTELPKRSARKPARFGDSVKKTVFIHVCLMACTSTA